MKTAKLGWTTLATSNFIPCKKNCCFIELHCLLLVLDLYFCVTKKLKLGLAGLEQYNAHTIVIGLVIVIGLTYQLKVLSLYFCQCKQN